MTNTNIALAQVEAAHRELVRLESRSPSDWVRDGWGIQAAQVAVDAARAAYMAAFNAYVVATA